MQCNKQTMMAANLISRVISKSTVKPASGETHTDFGRRIDLNPCDLHLITAFHIQKGLLFLGTSQVNDSLSVDHLKSSLSRTLDAFYPLAGRLSAAFETSDDGDKTAAFTVHCNAAGASFIHAAADGVSAAEILDSPAVPLEILGLLFPMIGVRNCEASAPLLAVHVTELADGAVFVSCSVNHAVADGASIWSFFNAWSYSSRHETNHFLSYPIFGPDLIAKELGIDLPIRLPFPNRQLARPPPQPPLERRVFHFSKLKIAAIKAEANNALADVKITALEAVSGYLWACVTRSRRLDADEIVRFKVLIDLRRLSAPLAPQEYFGNAIYPAGVEKKAGEVVERGVAWAARRIKSAIVSAENREEVKGRFMEWAEKAGNSVASNFPSNVLVLVGSPEFDVYGNDFGWGKPVAVRDGPVMGFDGKVVVFPGAEEGSMDFDICLSPETLGCLANDLEFLKL